MNFTNPPITEAIIDITVILDDKFDHTKLLDIYEEIKEYFPNYRKRMAFEGGIEFNLENPDEIINPQLLSISNKPEGYIFISKDQKRVIQAKLNGFTFSRLKPYEGWEQFYQEAYQLWQKYAEITSPIQVIRLGLRYINKIMIPAEGDIELNNYIKILPGIPDDLTATMEGYFMQIRVCHPKYQPSRAIINQTIGEVTGNNKGEQVYPLIFDIDVFQEVNLQANDNETITSIFEGNLRNLRDEIFFKSITEMTKELFK